MSGKLEPDHLMSTFNPPPSSELDRLFAQLTGTWLLMAQLQYGSGLRITTRDQDVRYFHGFSVLPGRASAFGNGASSTAASAVSTISATVEPRDETTGM